MQSDNLVERQWVDVIAPLAPPSDTLLLALLLLSLLLALSLLAQFIWKRRPRQIMRREIKWLQNTSSLTPRQKLHLLQQSICRYFRTSQLSQVPITHPDWLGFVATLQQAAYQRHSTAQRQARDLIRQALALLKVHG